ncbi:arsenate reductase, partial [mine drainage metagenome]
PIAAELARGLGYDAARLRSKSWDEFTAPDAPRMDFILTVCDSAAGESCPLWPGHPATAHWGVPDPAAVNGDEASRRVAYRDALLRLRRRIELLLALPDEKLRGLAARAELQAIAAATH